jgi:hypothetical protein|tara:strand:+ start:1417 stop:1569 length:153 start_codon:yes stop_codon:yes gene_type:complete
VTLRSHCADENLHLFLIEKLREVAGKTGGEVTIVDRCKISGLANAKNAQA